MIRYDGSWIFFEREREDHTTDLEYGTPWELIHFTAVGKKRQKFFNIFNEGSNFLLNSYFLIHRNQTLMFNLPEIYISKFD